MPPRPLRRRTFRRRTSACCWAVRPPAGGTVAPAAPTASRSRSAPGRAIRRSRTRHIAHSSLRVLHSPVPCPRDPGRSRRPSCPHLQQPRSGERVFARQRAGSSHPRDGIRQQGAATGTWERGVWMTNRHMTHIRPGIDLETRRPRSVDLVRAPFEYAGPRARTRYRLRIGACSSTHRQPPAFTLARQPRCRHDVLRRRWRRVHSSATRLPPPWQR